MKRRKFLNNLSILTGTAIAGIPAIAKATPQSTSGQMSKKRKLTVAHITDAHIRSGDNAPDRFKKVLNDISQKHKIDFFLNGGDSIHDASYKDVKRERVTQLWGIWDDCIKTIQDYDIYSCIGNHDPWWSAPNKQDDMYGKEYVVKRLHIPHRYYSFNKGGWHFLILDGNNEKISLDAEQYDWLEKDLEGLAPIPLHC